MQPLLFAVFAALASATPLAASPLEPAPRDLNLKRSATPSAPCPTAPVPIASPSAGYHCNDQGSNTDPGWLARFTSTTNDYRSCYAACLVDKSCVSFSYNQANNYCRTFRKTVNAKGFQQSTTSGKYYWNLKGCFVIPAGCSSNGASSTSTGGSVTPTTTTTVTTTTTTSSLPACTTTPAVNLLRNPSFESNDDDGACILAPWILDFSTNGNICRGDFTAQNGDWEVFLESDANINGPSSKLRQTLSGLDSTANYDIQYYWRSRSFSQPGNAAFACNIVTSLGGTVVDTLQVNAIAPWTQHVITDTPAQSSSAELSFQVVCPSPASGSYYTASIELDNTSMVLSQVTDNCDDTGNNVSPTTPPSCKPIADASFEGFPTGTNDAPTCSLGPWSATCTGQFCTNTGFPVDSGVTCQGVSTAQDGQYDVVIGSAFTDYVAVTQQLTNLDTSPSASYDLSYYWRMHNIYVPDSSSLGGKCTISASIDDMVVDSFQVTAPSTQFTGTLPDLSQTAYLTDWSLRTLPSFAPGKSSVSLSIGMTCEVLKSSAGYYIWSDMELDSIGMQSASANVCA